MTSMASEPEVLYNGITLPAQWPPRYAEPVEAKEMPVPYLTDKPAVIPINVGRQLFVDNFLISQTDLKPTYHTPDFFEGNYNPQNEMFAAFETNRSLLKNETYPKFKKFSPGFAGV